MRSKLYQIVVGVSLLVITIAVIIGISSQPHIPHRPTRRIEVVHHDDTPILIPVPDVDDVPEVIEELPQEPEVIVEDPLIIEELPKEIEPPVIDKKEEPRPVITNETITTTQAIDYKTLTQEDASRDKGAQVVTQQGQPGVREIVVELTYIDGVETSRITLSDTVTKQPVDHIVVIGTKEPVVSQNSGFESEVIRLTNVERQNAGLGILGHNSALDAGVAIRSSEIVGTWSHTRPNGSSFSTAFNVRYTLIGENIAKGYPTPSSVINGWMNSPGHRANILNPNFTHISIGHKQVDGYDYWVMILMTQ